MKNADYFLSFSLSSVAGSSRASMDKFKALSRQIPGDCVLYSLDLFEHWRVPKLFLMVALEFLYFYKSIKSKRCPDVIFSRSYFFFGTYLFSKMFKVPIYYEVHEDFWDQGKVLHKGKPLMLSLIWVYNKYRLFFLKSGAGIIFNHPDLQTYMTEKYNIPIGSTTFVYNGCDTDLFIPKNKEVCKKSLGLDVSKQYLVFVGSVCKWHGVEYLISAFEVFSNDANREYELLIVGASDEEYLNTLRSMAAGQNIHFTGRVSKQLVVDYIGAAELCLCPVRKNRISPGSPLKLFDYIACGRPVISQSDTLGYSDIVIEHNLGDVCDYASADETAKVWSDFLLNKDIETIGKNNRKVAESVYSWDLVIKKWLEFCNNRGLKEI